MSIHRARVAWELGATGADDFRALRYSRVHRLIFDGLVVEGSASPSIVPRPYARADAVDPEAAFTASLSACHMLWFLDHAARAGFAVASYRDDAEGVLAKNAEGKLVMARVTLCPVVSFTGDPLPSLERIAALHEAAHADCFIANSVKTLVEVIPAAP